MRVIVEPDSASFGTIPDEAKRADLTRDKLAGGADPYFVLMDKQLRAKAQPRSRLLR